MCAIQDCIICVLVHWHIILTTETTTLTSPLCQRHVPTPQYTYHAVSHSTSFPPCYCQLATWASLTFTVWQSMSVWQACMLLFDGCVCLVTWDPCAGRNGIALRTLVYHEVMVGYLDYVKRQGFTSMFIWACPPLQVCSLHILVSWLQQI